MSEHAITNRLCYLFLGFIIGFLMPKNMCNFPENDIEIVQDTMELKVLNEANLREELIRNNIPHVNIVLAQAKLESGNFRSKIVKTHQNIFGLKKGNKYRQYSHWTECVKDYKKYISNRYKKGDYFEFLNRIGYAEDSCYIEKLKTMI